MAAKVIERFWSAVRGSFAGLVASDASGATEDGVRLHADKADGALHVKSLVTPVSGASPSSPIGTPGRLPVNWTEDLDGINGTWHPRVSQVSIVRQVGAGPVTASAVGTTVTVSGIIVGTTTIADIQAAIAADAASAAVVDLLGTGTDVVGAGYGGGAAHDLWAEGMIPANALMALDATGRWTPFVQSDSSGISIDAARKYAGVDAGVVTVTNVTTLAFTGVNLEGRALYALDVTSGEQHGIASVTDPAGATQGTISLDSPLESAGDTVVVAYTAVPHGYSTTTDAIRSQNVAPEWSHYVEPTLFISQTSKPANGTYQFGPLPALDYGRAYFQIVWSTAGTRTFTFSVFGKMDNGAWAAAGTIPAAYGINGDMTATAASTAWGAAGATSGSIVSWTTNKMMFDSYMVEATVAATDGNDSTVTGYYGLSGEAR